MPVVRVKNRKDNMNLPKFLSLAAIVITTAGPLPAAEGFHRAHKFETFAVGQQEGSDKATDALKRGLAFLAARQNEDGSFGKENLQGSIGLTSLGGLALMPDRSHAGAVERALKFVLQSQQPDGYFHAQKGSMYDHGYATLFIAEALRTGIAPDAKEPLVKAVAVIQKSQGPQGGWRYKPQPAEGDSSVSSCQVMALAAARNAGVDVPADVITKAVGYLKKCQNADGGFGYVLAGGPGSSAFPRSAAALAATIATRELADIGIQPDVAKAADYVGQFLPKAGDPREQAGFFIHGLYYAEQASRSVPGDAAKQSREALREFLLASQQADGSWADKMSTDLATSQACLILQAGRAPRPGRAKSKTGGAALEKPGVGAVAQGKAADDAWKALKKMTGVDLLSSPRITTRSKQMAKIEIGREMRYPTASERDGKNGLWLPLEFD